MKRRKNKGAVVAIVASLSTVSLVSVGFAAWLITGGETASEVGNISVETVEDQRFHIATAADGSYIKAPTIYYGEDKNSVDYGYNETGIANQNKWLTVKTDGGVPENFHATVTFWVSNLSTTGKSNLSYSLTLNDEATGDAATANTAFTTAVGDSYVQALPSGEQEGSADTGLITIYNGENDYVTHSVDKLKYRKVSITLDSYFNWGSYFTLGTADGLENSVVVNPSRFFNDHKVSGSYITAEDIVPNKSITWGDEAKAVLSEVQSIAGAQFKLTLTTKA